jgi:hypothetical protein
MHAAKARTPVLTNGKALTAALSFQPAILVLPTRTLPDQNVLGTMTFSHYLLTLRLPPRRVSPFSGLGM